MLGITAEIAAVLRGFGTCSDNDGEAGLLAAGQLPKKGDPMPVEDLGKLMMVSAAQAKCPHFGLLVGQRGLLTTLGLLGCLMPRLRTVGIALKNLAWHLRQPDRAPSLILTVENGMAHLSYATDSPRERARIRSRMVPWPRP
ncbi:AraC family transcriptional regulator ligand-binding domain-containing protein [Methylorubrum extorquens]|jgi:hypothetical protein|uniref:AraC family transcriptional regulator ligand-binding domain-containing protein n=1 Tax=Methylorubrum extorquens TaxID=408 RepID=UPI003F5E18BD